MDAIRRGTPGPAWLIRPAYACQASRPAKPNGPAREPDLMRGLADQPAGRPARPTRTIFAAISVLPLACVGGRALPLAGVPSATRGSGGGNIGCIGGPHDPVWDRGGGLGVRP